MIFTEKLYRFDVYDDLRGPEGMVIFALYLLKTSAVPEGKRKYKGVKEI
jgi:hypothetical protein